MEGPIPANLLPFAFYLYSVRPVLSSGGCGRVRTNKKVMLNLFQHLIIQVTADRGPNLCITYRAPTYRVGCRNKFGMTLGGILRPSGLNNAQCGWQS
jgi:hypothetical protein